MPKTSTTYNFRVDEMTGTAEKVIEFCKSPRHGVVLCTREEGDTGHPNPHYHFAIRLSEPVSQETIRNWAKSLLPPGATKSDFQTATWDGEEKFLRYCCKGVNAGAIMKGDVKAPVLPPKVISSHLLGMTVEALHKDFWAENAKAAPAVKKRKEELVRSCIEHVKSAGLTTYADQLETACAFVLAEYKGKVNDHVAFPIIQSVMWSLNTHQASADFHSRMLKKFSRY